MLDDIIEVVLELVLDGAIEAAGSKKVPMPIRILAAGIVLVIALGLIGLLFWVGVDSNSTALPSIPPRTSGFMNTCPLRKILKL